MEIQAVQLGPQAVFVGILLAAAFVFFVFEWIPVALTALLALVVLAVGKILTPAEALEGFSNPAILTVASLFVVSASLVRTGVVGKAGKWIAALSGHSPSRAFFLLLFLAAITSAFINNTPVVVVLLPIALGVASEMKLSPSKLLMPIAFAATLGGMMTLVGTSTNVLVSSLWQKMGGKGLGMFEFAPLGAIVLAAGFVYLFTVGRRMLPDRVSVSSLEATTEYLTEITVPSGSPWAGKRLDETGLGKEVKVLQWIRGEEIAWPPFPERGELRAGDSLLLRGAAPQILAAIEKKGFELLPELQTQTGKIVSAGMRLAEIVITPQSALIGKTVEEAGLRRHLGVAVIAVQRRGIHVRERVHQMALRVGDVLLVHGSEEAIQGLRAEEDFLLVEGIHEKVPITLKAPLAVLVTGLLVGLASLDLFPIEFLAVTAAVALVLAGCLTLREAYRAIDWSVLLLIIGTLALGRAMEKTGLAAWIAENLIAALSPLGPVAVLSGIYLITLLVTELLSNNAAALLMLPIAGAAASALGVEPRAFVMAVAFGASLAFAVPAGYQTYMFIYGPGSYRFADFMKVGLPLDAICWILATIFLPVFWPLAR